MKRICVLGAAVAALLTAGSPAVALGQTTSSPTASVTCTFGLITTNAGNFKGSIQEFFGPGSLTAAMNLTPFSDLPPTPTTFSSANYYGTITISRGTGTLRGVTGTGSMHCTSTDQVHYACKERLKLTQAGAGSTSSSRRSR